MINPRNIEPCDIDSSEVDVAPDPLEAVYPGDILERIDRVLTSPLLGTGPVVEPGEPRRSLRGHAAGVALATAAVTGVRDAIEDDVADRSIETFDPTWSVSGGPDQAVTLFFVPHDPWSTRAVVRPWLLPSGTTPGPAVRS